MDNVEKRSALATWVVLTSHILLLACFAIFFFKALLDLNWLVAAKLSEPTFFWVSFFGVTPLLGLSLSQSSLTKGEKTFMVIELFLQVIPFHGSSIFDFSPDALGFFFMFLGLIALSIVIREIVSLATFGKISIF